MLEKIRTRNKAIARMIELVSQALNGKQVEQLAMIHVNNRQGAAELEQQLCARLDYQGPVLTADFTPGLSVHGGSGIVGVVVVEKF
jgi:fatty acid-binding protein DegV